MAVNNPLIDTAWLADHLDDPRLCLLDATWFMPDSPRNAATEYSERHIPGAHFFAIDEVRDHAVALPHMASSPAEFAVAARRLGVSHDSLVVVYDAEGLFSAPRVWWNFRAMGHDDTKVLDGGLPRWLAEGRPIETGWRDAAHGDFKARPAPALIAQLADIRAALDHPATTVVDARPAARFTGEAAEPRPGLRAGHMPGAVNMPYAALVRDGALAPPDDLRAAFETAGVDLTGPLVTTCGSGVSAAVLALALARLGRWDVAVYDGSWAEWGGRDDTPVVNGR